MSMAAESERAYHEYFVGLTLVIFVAAFIFRVRLMALLWLTIFTVIVYNIHCIYNLDLLNSNIHSSNFALFFSSNTYLLSSSILAIFGKYLIEIYREKIENEKIVLQNALLRAKESDKIKSSFLHTMSHEIRTPLNSIIGFSDVLLEEPDILEKHHLIKGINRQGYHLLDILTSMLEYSELQTKDDLGVKRKFPVAYMIKKAQNTFLLHQKKLDKFNIEFVSKIDNKHHELQVYTYADKLLSVLDEIVGNAVKFSESGQVILMMKIENGKDIVLSLSDDGIGIENGLEHSIFQDFSQLETEHNRSYGGIGIGLSICNKIISLMDGRLWYEKKAGNGTTFHISLKNVFIIE
jgi:signal transduction histidine kinase